MKKQFILLLLLSVLFIHFCKKNSISVMDNPNDPENPASFTPNSPKNLSIIAIDSTLKLTWADSSMYETGYLLEWQGIDETIWKKRVELAANTSTWIDSMPPVLSIRYRISAFNKQGETYLSKPGAVAEIDAKPLIISYVVTNDNTIKVNWINYSTFYKQTLLQISTDNSIWNDEGLANNPDTAKLFTTTQTYLGKDISIRLVNKTGNRVSNPSNMMSLKFDASLPTNFAVIAKDTALVLSWKKGFADGYLIEYQAIGEFNWQTRVELPVNTSTWTDNEPPSLAIRYRISAITGSGANKKTIEGEEIEFNGTPELNSATPYSSTEAKITWSVPNPIHKTILIEYSLNGSTWIRTATANRNDTMKVVSIGSSTVNQTISFRLIASSTNRISLASNEKSVVFTPSIATNFTVTPIDTTLKLNWETGFNNGFLIEYQTINDTSWTKRIELPVNTKTWIDNTPPTLSIRYRISTIAGSGTEKTFIEGPSLEFDATPNLNSVLAWSSSSSKITWKYSNAIHKEFKIEYSENGINWETLTKANRYDTLIIANFNKSVLNKSISVRVFSSIGSRSSNPSNVVAINFFPTAPSELNLIPVDTTLKLTWKSGFNDGYLIEYQNVNSTNWLTRIELPANTTSWIDTEPPYLSIRYRISSIIGSGTSKTTLVGNNTVEIDAKPVLKNVIAYSATEVKLSWNVQNPIHKTMQLETSFDGVNWSRTAMNVNRIDTAAIVNTGISFLNRNIAVRVATKIGNRISNYTSWLNVNFSLQAPYEIKIGFESDSLGVIEWNQPNKLHRSMEVQWKEGNNSWSNSSFFGLDTLVWKLQKSYFLHNTTYTWRFRAVSGTTTSTWVEKSEAFSIGKVFSVDYAFISDTKIRLDWTSEGSLIKNFSIYRSINNELPELITSSVDKSARTITLHNQPFADNSTYNYTVTPSNNRTNGTSYSTNPILFEFKPVSNVNVTTNSPTSVTIDWVPNAFGHKAIDIYTALATDTTKWTKRGVLAANSISYNINNLSIVNYFVKIDIYGDSLKQSKIVQLNKPTNTPDISVLHNLTKHKSNVRTVAISNDGEMLISGGDDDTLRVWNMNTGLQTRAIGVSNIIRAASISNDKSMFAFAVWGTFYIYSTSDGKLLLNKTIFSSSSYSIYSTEFSPNALSILTTDNYYGEAKTYLISDGENIRKGSGYEFAKYSEDGVNVYSIDSPTVYKLDASSFTTLKSNSSNSEAQELDISSDNSQLAIAAYNNSRYAVIFREAGSLDTVRVYRQTPKIYSVSYSPDNEYVAIGGDESNLKIVRVSDASLVGSYQGHAGNINKVRWAKKGNKIVSASDDGSVKIWSINSSATEWTVQELN